MADTAVDFLLDADGEMAVEDDDFVMVSGLDAVAQDLRLSLSFFRGDWFLDESIGIPYFQEILVKNPDLVVVKEHFRRALLDVPRVTAVRSLEVTLDASRLCTVAFTVVTDFGELTDQLTFGGG